MSENLDAECAEFFWSFLSVLCIFAVRKSYPELTFLTSP